MRRLSEWGQKEPQLAAIKSFVPGQSYNRMEGLLSLATVNMSSLLRLFLVGKTNVWCGVGRGCKLGRALWSLRASILFCTSGLLPFPAPIYLEEKAHRLSRAWCLKDSTHSTISLSCFTTEYNIHCSLYVVIEADQGILPCRDVTISTEGNLGLMRSFLKSHPQELSSVLEKEKVDSRKTSSFRKEPLTFCVCVYEGKGW